MSAENQLTKSRARFIARIIEWCGIWAEDWSKYSSDQKEKIVMSKKMKCRKLMEYSIYFAISCLGFIGSSVQAQMGDQAALIEALQGGGYVVYMRHGDTTGEPLDRTTDLNNRELQRNLSQRGRIQAQAIGGAIQRMGLQVGHVAASPVFRARDTAELAFAQMNEGQVEIDHWLIADDYVSGGYSAHVAKLREYLSTPPMAGNTWLVGHVIPISIATSSEVNRSNFPEGAAAIFRPESTGFELIGILGSGWEARY